MACAQVAGLAALLFQASPDATPDQVEAAILSSCDPCAEEQNHRACYGLVNPWEAWQTLQQRMRKDAEKERLPERRECEQQLERFVDPRLHTKLRRLPQDQSCEAVFVFDERIEPSEIAAIFQQSLNNDQHRVKFLRHARIVILLAPSMVIQELIEHPSVRVASACDIDRSPVHRGHTRGRSSF